MLHVTDICVWSITFEWKRHASPNVSLLPLIKKIIHSSPVYSSKKKLFPFLVRRVFPDTQTVNTCRKCALVSTVLR